LVFKVADALTDRGFLDAQCRTRFAEAAVVGGDQKIAKIAKLDTHLLSHQSPRS